jgi:hypothetical protein
VRPSRPSGDLKRRGDAATRSAYQLFVKIGLGDGDLAAMPLSVNSDRLEHNPEKWKPFFRKDHAQTNSMIRKNGNRFFRKDHAQTNSMIRKNGNRFFEKIVLKQTA